MLKTSPLCVHDAYTVNWLALLIWGVKLKPYP